MSKVLHFILVIIFYIPTYLSLDAQTVTTLVNLNRGSLGDGLAASKSGDLFFSSGGGNTFVFKITPQGEVSEFATGLQGAVGAFLDSQENLYVNSYRQNFLYKITPTGEASQFVTGLNGPAGIVINDADEIFVSEFGANFSGTGAAVKKILPDSSIELFASGGGLRDAIGIAQDDSSNLYVSNWGTGQIFKIAPDGSVAPFTNIGGSVNQIIYSRGFLYVPSPGLRKVFRVSLDGTIELIAGSGQSGTADGPALEASFRRPNSVAASPTGDSLYVVDADAGSIRIIDLTKVTGVQEGSLTIPQNFDLGNYPNPFNPNTQIRYSLNKDSFVTLKVFNSLGQEIRNLVDNFQVAGVHSFEFNANGLASGIYLARLKVGNHTEQTKKMLLLQ